MSGRDISFDEEVVERVGCGGAWTHGVLHDMVERMRARVSRQFDARAALADLRALLDTPLPTRPVRERLITRAICALSEIEQRERAHVRRRARCLRLRRCPRSAIGGLS